MQGNMGGGVSSGSGGGVTEPLPMVEDHVGGGQLPPSILEFGAEAEVRCCIWEAAFCLCLSCLLV